MAYTLGYFYADGHLSNVTSMRGKYVCFTSTDRDRIECFKRYLDAGHRILEIDRGGNRKTLYQIRIGNAKLYDRLIGYRLCPHKASVMCIPNIPG